MAAMPDAQNTKEEPAERPRQEKLPLSWGGETKPAEPHAAPGTPAKSPVAGVSGQRPAAEAGPAAPSAPKPVPPAPAPVPVAKVVPEPTAPVVPPSAGSKATPPDNERHSALKTRTVKADTAKAATEPATPPGASVPRKSPVISVLQPRTLPAASAPAAEAASRTPAAAPKTGARQPAPKTEPANPNARAAASGQTLGPRLREAREKLVLTTAQVSQKTKIPRDFIEMAEENRFAEFPPPVYSRSYLGQLCREYGLDATAVLDEYKAMLRNGRSESESSQLVLTSEVSETGAKVGYLPRSTAEGQEKVKKLSPTMMAVGVVLIGLVVLGLIVAVMYNRGGGTAAPEGGTASGPVAGTQVNLETFITPQQLPMKELPVPNR